MSRQAAILPLAADVETLLRFASERAATGLPQLIPVSSPPSPVPARELDATGSTRILFLIPSGVPIDALVLQTLSGKADRRKIMVACSPVIELYLPRSADGLLCAGRLYFALPPDEPHYAAARRLYDALERFVDKWPKGNAGAVAVGPAAFAAAKAGTVKLGTLIGQPVRLPASYRSSTASTRRPTSGR